MKSITNLIRLALGALFIFSGFVKLVDPVGMAFKLEEYFAADVLNLPFLEPFALPIALFVIILEVLLGVMLLLGYKVKFTLWSYLLLDLFFTFLTFYSAYFNKVTDCGCFGDAIKLEPWETFGKDVIILALIAILFLGKDHIKPIFTEKWNKAISLITVFSSLGLAYYVLIHLPIIDFRPYAVGKNIEEGMEVPEGAPVDQFKNVWVYRVDGEEKEYTDADAPWDIEGAEYVDRKTILVEKGYEPPIHDFSIETEEGEDITFDVLAEERVLLVVAYEMHRMEAAGFIKVNEKLRELNPDFPVMGLSATMGDDLTPYKEKYQIDYPVNFTDGITLKTIVRSFPGLVLLERGTVVAKWSWHDFVKLEAL